VTDAPTKPPPLTEADLRHWRLLADFRQVLDRVWATPAAPWSDVAPERRQRLLDYLGLFLFGLFNPALRTTRALTHATDLTRVQREICARTFSLGHFSETQHLCDPLLLERCLDELTQRTGFPAGPAGWRWQVRDGSLFRALPRMAWALYGGGQAGQANRAVRLHLSLDLASDQPVGAQVRPGQRCERAVWKECWQAGDAFVADRYFSEHYALLGELSARGCAYVVRLRRSAVIQREAELPLSAADRQAGVVRQAWARLGADPRTSSERLRVVWVHADGHELILITNQPETTLPAALVSQLYRQRWQVELFFRWIKCVLGCGHWLAESARGTTMQLYLALIAAVLLQLYVGRRPTQRMLERLQLYFLGWASAAELERGLQRERERLARLAARAKKSS
jgi:hypothetical protein